jgi:hypothetical protein
MFRKKSKGIEKNLNYIFQGLFFSTLAQRDILQRTPFCDKTSVQAFLSVLTKWEHRKNTRCATHFPPFKHNPRL